MYRYFYVRYFFYLLLFFLICCFIFYCFACCCVLLRAVTYCCKAVACYCVLLRVFETPVSTYGWHWDSEVIPLAIGFRGCCWHLPHVMYGDFGDANVDWKAAHWKQKQPKRIESCQDFMIIRRFRTFRTCSCLQCLKESCMYFWKCSD